MRQWQSSYTNTDAQKSGAESMQQKGGLQSLIEARCDLSGQKETYRSWRVKPGDWRVKADSRVKSVKLVEIL